MLKVKGLDWKLLMMERSDTSNRQSSIINKESDMNVPGIAKAKKSYHPLMTVKSKRRLL